MALQPNPRRYQSFYPSFKDLGPWLFDFAAEDSGNGEEGDNFLADGVTITDYDLTLTVDGVISTDAEIIDDQLVNTDTGVKVWLEFGDDDIDILLTCQITTSAAAGGSGDYEHYTRSMLFRVRRR